jgi:hypothetical protein
MPTTRPIVLPSAPTWSDYALVVVISVPVTASICVSPGVPQGICDYQTGTCSCRSGFTGAACDRLACTPLDQPCGGAGRWVHCASLDVPIRVPPRYLYILYSRILANYLTPSFSLSRSVSLSCARSVFANAHSCKQHRRRLAILWRCLTVVWRRAQQVSIERGLAKVSHNQRGLRVRPRCLVLSTLEAVPPCLIGVARWRVCVRWCRPTVSLRFLICSCLRLHLTCLPCVCVCARMQRQPGGAAGGVRLDVRHPHAVVPRRVDDPGVQRECRRGLSRAAGVANVRGDCVAVAV